MSVFPKRFYKFKVILKNTIKLFSGAIQFGYHISERIKNNSQKNLENKNNVESGKRDSSTIL